MRNNLYFSFSISPLHILHCRFTLNDYSFVYRLPKIRFPLHVFLRFFVVCLRQTPQNDNKQFIRYTFTAYQFLCHSERSEESQDIFYIPLTLTLSPHFIRRPHGSLKGEGILFYPRLPFTVYQFPCHSERSEESKK